MAFAAGQSASFSLNGNLGNVKQGESAGFKVELEENFVKVNGTSPSFQLNNALHAVSSSSSSSSSSVASVSSSGGGGGGGCRSGYTCPGDITGGDDGGVNWWN